jgi:hypothetical protein
MIREKQITIKSTRIKINIKIKLNQIMRHKIKKNNKKELKKTYNIQKIEN